MREEQTGHYTIDHQPQLTCATAE